MGSSKASLTGGRVQVIINGVVQFDQHVDVVDVTSILHAEDDGLAFEMQFGLKFGHRRPDGTVIVGDPVPEQDQSVLRSGGQTHQFGPRPRIAKARPGLK